MFLTRTYVPSGHLGRMHFRMIGDVAVWATRAGSGVCEISLVSVELYAEEAVTVRVTGLRCTGV